MVHALIVLQEMDSEITNAVSGYSVRFDRKREAISRDISASDHHPDGLVGVIRWHIHTAGNDLLERHHVEELIESMASALPEPTKSTIRQAVRDADDQALASSKAIPEFSVGSLVEVVLNAKNLTPHSGTVRDAIWHFKDKCWSYYIEEDGKHVSKRYLAADLKTV